MSKDVRIKLNSAEVAALLRSDAVGRDLEERARRIANAAGPGMEVSRRVGRKRQRVSIITATAEARRAEAERRALTQALDAGRG
jgi:hypothetical protein